MTTHIAAPHPQLGRPGAVCPFVPPALRRDLVRYTLSEPEATDVSQVEQAAVLLKQFWESMPPVSGKYVVDKVAILALPRVSTATLLTVHERLKPLYVEEGMMLGEFYADHDAVGLHSTEFRPFRSPLPLLIARRMVAADLPFLTPEHYSPARRVEYVEAFLRHQPTASRELRERAKAMRERDLPLIAPQDADERQEDTAAGPGIGPEP